MIISQDSILRNRWIHLGLSAIIIVGLIDVYLMPEQSIADEKELQVIKTLDCHELRDRIYNQDFERILSKAIYEYEWRCLK